MATGHLAHDLKHDRKVALKVLKPELAVGKKDPVTTDVATGISIGTDGWSCVGLSPSSLVSRVSDEVMSDPVAAWLEPATP